MSPQQNPYNNLFYPFSMGLKERANLMFLLVGDYTLNKLYTYPYWKILDEHITMMNFLLEKIPKIIESLTGTNPAPNPWTLKTGMLGPLTILRDLIRSDDDTGISLQELMETEWADLNHKYKITPKLQNVYYNFEELSQDVWDEGYPLLYWNIKQKVDKDRVRNLFDDKSPGCNFLCVPTKDGKTLGEMKFRDGFFKSKLLDTTTQEIYVIHEAIAAKVIGISPLNNQPQGHGWCCQNYTDCIYTGNEEEFCIEVLGSNGDKRCSELSTPCDPSQHPSSTVVC